MSDRDEDHVGFGRPPKWGQFQNGKSGNPKGRPRKTKKEAAPPASSDLDDLLNDVFDQKVTIKEDGQTKEITMKAAIAKRLAADAVKGNHYAQREALRLARAVEENEAKRAAAEKQAEAERSEKEEKERQKMCSYLRDLKARELEEWNVAQEAGLEEPTQPWPHPDEIILKEGGDEYGVRGPINAKAVPAWEDLRRIRDLFLIELVLAIAEDVEPAIVRLSLASMAN